MRKVITILWKTLKYTFLVLILLLAFLFVALNTEGFQTWLAQRATAYLSSELHTKITIGKVKLAFVKKVVLEDVYVEDLSGDTLLNGKQLIVDITGFSIRQQKLRLDDVQLNDVTAKVLYHKGEDDLNMQFLIDYFSSSDTTTSTSSGGWQVKYNKLLLNNVDFTYWDMNDTTPTLDGMDYNHLRIRQIHGEFSDIRMRKDTIWANITNLTAHERCGLYLQSLTTIAKVSPVELRCDSLDLKTADSHIRGRFSFEYSTWDDYNDFIPKVFINAHLKDSSRLCFKDIAYFAPELNGFNETIGISGDVKGTVTDLKGKDLDLYYGDNTHFMGDLSITGLPDINSTFLHFDVKRLSTSRNDLLRIPVPPFNQMHHLEIPDYFSSLGVVSYRGKFDGFLNDFNTRGTFSTSLGNVYTDLALQNDTVRKTLVYHGQIKTQQFNIGRLFPDQQDLETVALDVKMNGRGLTINDMNAKIEGVISSLVYRKHNYYGISLNGEFHDKVFDGKLISKDTLANLDFYGKIDFRGKVPGMDFISTINALNLPALNLFEPFNQPGYLSTQMAINLQGDNLDNLTGRINLDNTKFKTSTTTYSLSTLDLTMDQSQEHKSIRLNSNYIFAKIEGQYQLSNLPDAFGKYLRNYFPTLFKRPAKEEVYSDSLSFRVRIKKFDVINALVYKDLMVSPNTVIDGHFDARYNDVGLNMRTDWTTFKKYRWTGATLDLTSLEQGINADFRTQRFNIADSLWFGNIVLKTNVNNNRSDVKLSWANNTKPDLRGEVDGSVLFNTVSATIDIQKARFVVRDSSWTMTAAAPLVIDTGYILVNPITFINRDQMISVQGKVSHNPADRLDLNVNNFELSQLDPLLVNSMLSLKGTVSGKSSLSDPYSKPIFLSGLDFKSVYLNNKELGDGQITTEYNREHDVVTMDGYFSYGARDSAQNLLKNVNFQGNYYPSLKENSLDLKFHAEPLSLTLLDPFLKDILTFKMGYLAGDGAIKGTLDRPEISGRFKIMKCVMKVDYLNVQYSVNGNVTIYPDQISFEGININDPYGNTGLVYGNIFHNNFKDMRIDFDINTKKLQVLNTTAALSPSYYGKAFATGNAGLYGFVDNIKLELHMKTEKGTQFIIPLDGPTEVGENGFITFVTKDTVQKKKVENYSGFSLDMHLEATPDAEVQLIFDAKSGDIIRASGQGELDMKIDSKGKFDMFGTYALTQGDYLFSLENFISKKFDIERGSTIKWSGTPYDAEINITANYKQRTSIAPLFPFDSSGTYRRRYPIDCKLYMRNTLMKPDITFGVDAPTIDEDTRSKIRSIMMDEQELNRQVFSLLLLGSFVTPLQYSGSGGITAGNAVASNSSEMLSIQLSKWLNSLTSQVDIGVNYRPGTSLSSEELEVALSKQLFNNRVSIDGNFGVNSSKTKTNSNWIGDVNIEYKLTDDGRYRIKGFNRSNDNTQMTTSGGPFTQGVGIFYREEFENVGELFKRYGNTLRGILGSKKEAPPVDTTHTNQELIQQRVPEVKEETDP